MVIEPRRATRPWILTKSYWNEVAKDAVKAVVVGSVVYLGGVVANVFPKEPRILIPLGLLGTCIALLFVVSWLAERAIARSEGRRPGLWGALGMAADSAAFIGTAILCLWLYGSRLGLPAVWAGLAAIGSTTAAFGLGSWLLDGFRALRALQQILRPGRFRDEFDEALRLGNGDRAAAFQSVLEQHPELMRLSRGKQATPASGTTRT